jgi:hypothetical protein
MEDALAWAAAHVTEAVDVARATSLLDRARAMQAKAAAADIAETASPSLRALVAQIWDLFPTSPDLQRQSFDSGVR